MFQLRSIFHTVHIADDLVALDKFYENTFGPVCMMKHGYLDAEKRDASSFAFSDYSVETMAPAHVEGAESLPVGRFLARFGRHLYSLGLYVTDMPDFYESLRANNIRVVGGAGRVFEETPRIGEIYTHPRDTLCLFEVADPDVTIPGGHDPRLTDGWSTAYWRDGHPLGLERTSHYTIVTRDLEKAKTLYGDVLRCQLIHEGENAASKTQSAYFAVGKEAIIELAQPTAADSLAGQELEKNGETIHGVTFKVKDIAKAESYLTGKRLRIENRQADSFVLNRDDAFGAVYGFTQTSIPNDPRG